MIDQALFAGTHFGVNVLLGRWATPVEFGAFNTAYAVFLLAAAVHVGTISEPLMVLGSGQYRSRFSWYLGVVLRAHWALTCAAASILGLAALVLVRSGSTAVGSALGAAAAASPFILLLWLMRRAVYVPAKPQWAIVGGLTYLGILLGGMVTLERFDRVSASAALLLMGGTALPVAVGLAARLRPRFALGSHADARTAIAESWRYGSWSLGVQVLVWATNNIQYVTLAAFHGLAEVAELRAVTNIFLPFQHVMIGVSAVLLPGMSRGFWDGGRASVRTYLRNALVLLAPLSVLYVAAVVTAGPLILHALYGGRYDGAVHLIWLALPLPLLWVPMGVVGAALRAVQEPSALFKAYLLSGVVVLAVATPLIVWWGSSGALVGWAITFLTLTILVLEAYRRSEGPGVARKGGA